MRAKTMKSNDDFQTITCHIFNEFEICNDVARPDKIRI